MNENTSFARIGNQNALRHGLTSAAVVLPQIESREEWEEFRTSITDSLAPSDALECELAARIAELLWRRRRVARAEVQAIDAATERDAARFDRLERVREVEAAQRADPNSKLSKLDALLRGSIYASTLVPEPPEPPPAPRLVPADDDLKRLLRYEAHLTRQLLGLMHELEARQQRRVGQPAPLARVDVQSSSTY